MEEGSQARRVLILLVAGEAIAVVALTASAASTASRSPATTWAGGCSRARARRCSSPASGSLRSSPRGGSSAARCSTSRRGRPPSQRRARPRLGDAAGGAAMGGSCRRRVDRRRDRAGVGRPAAADPPPTTSPASAPVVVDVDHRDPARVPSRPPSGVRTGQAVDSPPASTVPPTGTTFPAPTTPPLVPPTAPPPLVTTTPAAPVAPAAPAVPPPAPAAGTTHTVTGGEHLWSIAAARVAGASRQGVSRSGPCRHRALLARVVELNRHRLRSGNRTSSIPAKSSSCRRSDQRSRQRKDRSATVSLPRIPGLYGSLRQAEQPLGDDVALHLARAARDREAAVEQEPPDPLRGVAVGRRRPRPPSSASPTSCTRWSCSTPSSLRTAASEPDGSAPPSAESVEPEPEHASECASATSAPPRPARAGRRRGRPSRAGSAHLDAAADRRAAAHVDPLVRERRAGRRASRRAPRRPGSRRARTRRRRTPR